VSPFALLSIETKHALRRPVTALGAAWFLLSGMGFAVVLGLGASPLAAGMRGLVLGLQYAAVPALLIGTAAGGEDDDLRTKPDLWLAGIHPGNLLTAKLVIGVDLAVLLSSLMFLGGVVAGSLMSVLAPASPTDAGLGANLGPVLALVVLFLPFIVVASGLTAAALRSRLGGAVVWLGLFVLYVGSRALAPGSPVISQLVKLLPIGSAYALASGRALPGLSETSMSWWAALITSAAWLGILGIAVRFRWRNSGASTPQTSLLRRTGGSSWRRHAVVASSLILALGASACVLPGVLSRLGASHDSLYRTLAHVRQQDFLQELASVLERGDFEGAESIVGPAGSTGLAALEAEIERSKSDWAVMIGEVGDATGTYPSLSLQTAVRDADGTKQVVLGNDYAFDLVFEHGRWQVIGIRRAD
jgi:hypothetical protein